MVLDNSSSGRAFLPEQLAALSRASPQNHQPCFDPVDAVWIIGRGAMPFFPVLRRPCRRSRDFADRSLIWRTLRGVLRSTRSLSRRGRPSSRSLAIVIAIWLSGGGGGSCADSHSAATIREAAPRSPPRRLVVAFSAACWSCGQSSRWSRTRCTWFIAGRSARARPALPPLGQPLKPRGPFDRLAARFELALACSDSTAPRRRIRHPRRSASSASYTSSGCRHLQ